MAVKFGECLVKGLVGQLLLKNGNTMIVLQVAAAKWLLWGGHIRDEYVLCPASFLFDMPQIEGAKVYTRPDPEYLLNVVYEVAKT